MQFIAWLITAAGKCRDMDVAQKMNEESRKHSTGLKEKTGRGEQN